MLPLLFYTLRLSTCACARTDKQPRAAPQSCLFTIKHRCIEQMLTAIL